MAGKNAHPTCARRKRAPHCHYCGTEFTPQNKATKDHLWPQSMGGSSQDFNIVDACKPCNQAKGNNPPPLKVIFEVQEAAIKRMVGCRDMARLQSMATMVAAIAYYLRTNKKPRKNEGLSVKSKNK